MRRGSLAQWRIITVCIVLLGMTASAQELEPRVFSPAPIGLDIVVILASYSTGDLVFDSSLPIRDSTADTAAGGVSLQHYFGLLGCTAKVSVNAAWIDARAEGLVADVRRERRFGGLGDPRIALSVIFAGAPAMTEEAFRSWRPRTLGGFSIGLSAPLGEYDDTKVLNAGTNRWTLRAQLGIAHYHGPWTFEGTLGGQFFTDNDEYLVDSTQSQAPIVSFQGHVSYAFRPQLWLSAGATYYRGGEAEIDGVAQPGSQSNSRYGAAASVPLTRGQSLSISWSRGLFVRTGSDFDTLTLAWIVRR